MSGIASNIVLKEDVRDPTPLLLLTDRMWDSSSFKGSDMSKSPEFLLRGTVRALGLSMLVLPFVLSSVVGFAITVLLAPWSLAPITGGFATGDVVVTLLPTGVPVEEVLVIVVVLLKLIPESSQLQ